jgi:DNA-binding NtrC family response regulator
MAAKSIKILLLEDDTAHAEAIMRELKDTGYKIRVAGTLREYYESVAADPPDIALLDIFLPDGGAMEVLSSHQQTNPFPLLVMTSQGNEQHAVDAMKAGALDYIVKSPEAFADMPGIITHAIDHWKLLQERKWGEEELRKSELRYRDLVNNSKNAVAIYEAAADGEDFIFKDFNSAAENIEKVKKEDIIGKSVLQAFPGVKEFGLFEVFQRVWRTGVPESLPLAQ